MSKRMNEKRLTNGIHQICMPPIVFSVSAWLANNKEMSLHCDATNNNQSEYEGLAMELIANENRKWDHFVKNGYQFKIHKTDGWWHKRSIQNLFNQLPNWLCMKIEDLMTILGQPIVEFFSRHPFVWVFGIEIWKWTKNEWKHRRFVITKSGSCCFGCEKYNISIALTEYPSVCRRPLHSIFFRLNIMYRNISVHFGVISPTFAIIPIIIIRFYVLYIGWVQSSTPATFQ